MKRIALALVLASFTACSQTSKTSGPIEPTVKPTATAILVVSRDGTQLGTIRIPPGELGTLVPVDLPAAQELIEQWAKIERAGAVGISSHTNDHGKRVYGTRLYYPTSAGFADAILAHFKYERGYDVEMTTTSSSAPPRS